MEKTARLYRKERTIEGFVLSRTPIFSPLTHPQISSRERRLGAIFNKLTIPARRVAFNWDTDAWRIGSPWCGYFGAPNAGVSSASMASPSACTPRRAATIDGGLPARSEEHT